MTENQGLNIFKNRLSASFFPRLSNQEASKKRRRLSGIRKFCFNTILGNNFLFLWFVLIQDFLIKTPPRKGEDFQESESFVITPLLVTTSLPRAAAVKNTVDQFQQTAFLGQANLEKIIPRKVFYPRIQKNLKFHGHC